MPVCTARGLLLPLPPVRDHSQGAAPSSYAQDNTAAESPSVKAADEEAEEEEDDTYVSPEGQGCFSFRQRLLFRAKDTYAARCTGNKYEIISQVAPHWPCSSSLKAQLANFGQEEEH